MRLLLGVVLGVLLTVVLAYVHDSAVRPPAGQTAGGQTRMLVNWKVAEARWHDFTADVTDLGRRARDGFNRLASRS